MAGIRLRGVVSRSICHSRSDIRRHSVFTLENQQADPDAFIGDLNIGLGHLNVIAISVKPDQTR